MDGWDYLTVGAPFLNYKTLVQANGWYGKYYYKYSDIDYSSSTYPILGRFGRGTALRVVGAVGYQGTLMYMVLDSTVSGGFVMGFAINHVTGYSAPHYISLVNSDASAAAVLIALLPLGTVSFSPPGATYTTRAGVIRDDNWNYVEIKHTPTLFQAKINGDIVVNVINPVAPAAFNAIGINMPFDTGEMWLDDLYINDLVGPTNSDYLGNVEVPTQLPVGNGDLVQFTPVGGVTNWLNVKDPNLLSTVYNQDATVGQSDLYHMNPNASARTIFAVQARITYAQDNGVQLFSKNQIKTNGVVYLGHEQGAAQIPNYASQSDYWDLNPNTGIKWTNTDINNLQAGPLLSRSD